MDRRSNKEIVKCITIWLVLVFILTMGLWLFTNNVLEIKNQQLTEIITIHSALDIEMKENFQFYQQQFIKSIWYFYLFLIIVSALFCSSLHYILERHEKRKDKNALLRMNAINEQLSQFLKGDFQMTQALLNKENEIGEEGEWLRIRESLSELGSYFSSLKEQLEKEEDNTKAFITDISHQLKTPLASLRMSHELLEVEKLTDWERKEFEVKEEQEIRKLEFLLEELVNLSRLEHHMIQIRPEVRSIKKTLLDAINQVYMKAYGKSIDMEVKMEEEILVRHDSKWTVEALANVLDNAIKYSEPKSHIEVRITRLTMNLLIEIEDEGIGIREEELHLIFQRFYRGKDAAKVDKDGAGVGLYLARSILEQQGGTIIAKRKREKGTIFKITLPLT